MKRTNLLLIALFILEILSVFFIFPKFPESINFGSKFLPWRLGLDLVGGSHLIYEVDMSRISDAGRDSVMAGLRDVIEKRVNLFGVSEPQVVSAKEGEAYRLIVELAGVKDISAAINQIGETPFLEFREVIGSGTSTQFLATNLTGRYLKSAQLDFNQTTGGPFLSIEFNDEGAKLFEEVTEKNVGKQICTFVDYSLADCATVQEKISGGKAQITGKFTVDEVKQMASRFNAGALPAPIKLISQQTVGASLGQESLEKAVYAGAIGTLIIILFMISYYRNFGFFASLALLIYIPLTLAVFKIIPGFTMTLAGIAGFILSIGMAVDANVLIFERTKEEIKNGLSKALAIEEGFKRAWPSIRDSNASTIITSVILYYFASSFVKGFALALLIGVLVSMFSAITITRTLLRAFIKNKI
ncbi:MAG: protein translocase subunit SecD [Patescibacteria group bacterium]